MKKLFLLAIFAFVSWIPNHASAQQATTCDPANPNCQQIFAYSTQKSGSTISRVSNGLLTNGRKAMSKKCKQTRSRVVTVSSRIAIARVGFQFQGTANFEFRCVPIRK